MRALLVMLLLGWTLSAYADELEPAAEAPTPWSKGVSEEQQTRANALSAEANQLFGEQAHAAALEKYQQALAQWDHPSVRLNMAVTLIRLDRFLEAAEALNAALRYGAAPFPADKYQLALDYKKLVDRQVGTVTVSCSQASTTILLDGKTWFTCPAEKEQRVLAGEHVVVGEARGFMTQSRRIVVGGGGAAQVTMTLVPIESAVRLEYPTRRWIPWSIAIGGAVVGLAGVPVWYAGRRHMDRADALFRSECADGCELDLSDQPALRESYESAELKGTAGVTMMIAGGVTALGGILWAVVFNRPHRVMPDFEVAPTADGITAAARWRL